MTVELAVESALEKTHKKFIQALIVDGSIKSVADAEKLANELIKAQKKYLTGW